MRAHHGTWVSVINEIQALDLDMAFRIMGTRYPRAVTITSI
jgi:hypothetical protein